MDTNRRVIPIFIAQALAGEELTVYGDGKLLDFVHTNDICDGILTAVSRRSVVSGRTINLGSETGTPLSTVAASITDTIDACPGWRVADDREGDIGQYVSNLSTANAVLCFEPSLTFNEGLLETIKWYVDHPELIEEIRTARR